jgi:hypothetical protein
MLKRYDVNTSDNLKARKIYTQFNILENIIIFIIVIMAIGIALMSFESIRSIGVSVLTSAGIAGIIIGFSAPLLRMLDFLKLRLTILFGSFYMRLHQFEACWYGNLTAWCRFSEGK